MATEEEVLDIEEETQEEKGKKIAKHDCGAADLEKVTDYVEEAEISSGNLAAAMSVMTSRQEAESLLKQQHEKELSKIKISKEDVDLIVEEMEIPRSAAERKLREHRGNVVNALMELTT